jgi:hypothetical protein
MKRARTVFVFGFAVLLAVTLSTPGQASCVGANLVHNTGYITNVDAPYIYEYAEVPIAGDSFDAYFWSAGSGDPAVMAGNDSGTTTGASLLFGTPPAFIPPYWYNYANQVFSNWGAGGVDGCVNADGPDACTCILLSEDGQNGRGYFALASAKRNVTGDFIVPGDVQLGRIPDPIIVAASGGSQGDVLIYELMVLVPSPVQGLTLDSDCAGVCFLDASYRVFQQTVPNGAPAPLSRDRNDWIDVSGVDTPLGDTSTVTVECPWGLDLYLTTWLTFDSGFSLPVVSGNSVRVPCVNILAEPEPIRQLQRPDRRPRERSGKPGRIR